MDLEAIATEVAARANGLPTLSGLPPLPASPALRAFPFPDDLMTPPFACCGFPDTPGGIKLTYSPSSGRITLPFAVGVSKASPRMAWRQMSAFASTEGASSVTRALEDPDEYEHFDTLCVLGQEWGDITWNDVVYLGVTFELDITA